MKRSFILVVFIFSLSSQAKTWVDKVFKHNKVLPCETSFVSYLNKEKFLNSKTPKEYDLWGDHFDPEKFSNGFEKLSRKELMSSLVSLKKLAYKDIDFINNLSELTNVLIAKKLISVSDAKFIFLDTKASSKVRFYFSELNQKLSGRYEFDTKKVALVQDFVKKQELSKELEKEYIDALMFSNRSYEDISLAIESGLSLRSNARDFNQFKDYLDFLESANTLTIKKAMINIDSIYDYNFTRKFYTTEIGANPQKTFLIQKSKIHEYQEKTLKDTLNTMKKEKGSLTSKDRRRAIAQAKSKAGIYKRLTHGCNGSGGKSLASAKKKFKRFKIGLSLVGTPSFYYIKNKDKLDKKSEKYDPYWFERLGYEMGMSLLFTAVANKIVTNTNTSFWGKYLGGYVKFGSIDAFNAIGYDLMFGKRGYASLLQKVYRDDISSTPLEEEFLKLKNSPDFEQDLKYMFDYLDQRSYDQNLKNFLNSFLNLSAYDSSLDPARITIEDLESSESKEMLMELLAEKMYAENMGEVGAFQTGNHGADRWLFYRARNVLWDMKSLLMNLSIFHIMCREPLGKVGSWGLIMGIVLGNEFLSGDFTYEWRRKAINQ